MGVAEKKEWAKKSISDKHGCNGACPKCVIASSLIDKMYDSNIPAGYWLLSMKHFKGAPQLKEEYDNYVKNLSYNYMNGRSLCFSGNQGTGKTMTAIGILKRSIASGFSAYYTTAADLLNDMTNYKGNAATRSVVRNSDFVVIDEMDSRFFVSDSVKELFSGIYESVFRHRSHNLLPTILCSNEIDGISNIFYGPCIQSIESLNNQYLTLCPIIGKDYRKTINS